MQSQFATKYLTSSLVTVPSDTTSAEPRLIIIWLFLMGQAMPVTEVCPVVGETYTSDVCWELGFVTRLISTSCEG